MISDCVVTLRKRVAKTVLTTPLPDSVDRGPVCAGVPSRAEHVAFYQDR